MRPGGSREVIYGRQPVLEMLRAERRDVSALCIRGGMRPSAELEDIEGLAAKRGVGIRSVVGDELAGMTEGGHHQGVAAEVSAYPYASLDDIVARVSGSGERALVLLLDHIQDPQNVGSLLRTAEAAGVDGVVIPADRASGVTPAAVRASAGAAEHLHVARVTNLVRTMKALKDAGLWIAGLDAAEGAELYTEADLKRALGIVVGSEGHGVGRLVGETCDFLIRIPLLGHVASLNAGVAGAVALYEVRRRQSAE